MYIAYTLLSHVHTCKYQVLLINRAIDAAKAGSSLYKLPHVADPSYEIVEVLVQCMDWNIASRQSGIPESELPALQQKVPPDQYLQTSMRWNVQLSLTVI